jgi:S-adenosylmethionine hydrolase
MKGTILSLCPSAVIVDTTHEIEKFNIRMGALALAAAAKYFPEGTIHVAVVDPGVGGARRDLLIESNHFIFIGPDNGILVPAASQDGIKAGYSIENPGFMRNPVSSTFHGRDVFAYVAGRIAAGAELPQVGPRVSDPVPAAFPQAVAYAGRIACEVLVTDSFGNIVTTAREGDLEVAGIETGASVRMRRGRRVFGLDVRRSYSDSIRGRGLLLVGSHGFLEIALNKASAAKRFRVRPGDELIFTSG